MIPVFDGHIEHGVPVIDDIRFTAYCGKWSHGTPLSVTVRKRRRKVSDPQIRYYYGVICKLISDHTGHSVEEVDWILKNLFMKCVDGMGLEFVPSKLDNSTMSQEEFHAKCRKWAGETFRTIDPETGEVKRFYIPLPNEVELDEHILIT